MNAEKARLEEDAGRIKNWKRWGPYLSDRQWSTVREDYSPHNKSWEYFDYETARSRAYRWGEDGILGITDRQCRLCFSVAMWNGRDPHLKERLFGLTGPQGNHGEDVKENYYYLAGTPTSSYLKALYKYPQAAFPYERLIEENKRRGLLEREFELNDTGIFDNNEYFDVTIEYAKADAEDILIRITIENRAARPASLTFLPTLWFRNTWSWGCTHEGCTLKPRLWLEKPGRILSQHESLPPMALLFEGGRVALFTENETNTERLFNYPNCVPYQKDGFDDYILRGESGAVNPRNHGTKIGILYPLELAAGASTRIELRLCRADNPIAEVDSDALFATRIRESDEYLQGLYGHCEIEELDVVRQAAAGLFWNKQFYHFIVHDWLTGDAYQPLPPQERWRGRNINWQHLYARDVISMPDKWEYPWFAVWDLAFHMLPLAKLDPDFAKAQLQLFLREWYMHPNGQLPAYEFEFSEVNPPVHAWAVWRVYKIAATRGARDHSFLESAFHKLLLNFTWWVNRKDTEGNNIFAGGFLGLDNIGVFDRAKPLPTGGHLQQADGTAWMGFYCLTMLSISLELAQQNHAYEDMASKFFEHFIAICDSINTLGGAGLWDDTDGFYYDRLKLDGQSIPLKTRSLVGILPMVAVEVLDRSKIDQLPGFKKRLLWFLKYRPEFAKLVVLSNEPEHPQAMLAMPTRERLCRILSYLFDENEFLAPYGIRSLSRMHEKKPYTYVLNGNTYRVAYLPAESDSLNFGGNSNWRGPIWFPINFLIIEALERYHRFYGDSVKVEFPTGSGRPMNLQEIADELSRRLMTLFLPDASGRRPCHGEDARYAADPAWRDLALFYEYFHPETGRGCGAPHQTGWTALLLNLL
jgi:Mannosylglycerate hydrolase MGH1-like glycoside hydrolase domain